MPKLTPIMTQYILHWGEMGTRWGVNRSMAQIHALLYLSPEPLSAEEIASTLNIARSNVSTSLRELQGWGIVKTVHVMGDRRDYYETLTDVWEMFRIIVEQRKMREIDPTLKLLRECMAESPDPDEHPEVRKRIGAMRDFFESNVSLYEQFARVPLAGIKSAAKMGPKIRKFLGL